MRRYLLLMGLLVCSLSACKFVEDDVFEHTPSQRFEIKAAEFEKILVQQKNGWLLDFFPGETRRYGGFNIILHFEEGRKVRAASEFATTEEASYYDIEAANGGATPSIIFDTFNSILHHYSIPSSAFARGKGGDFDFLISYADGVFTLKGKTSGNTMYLRPFTGASETDFFAKVNKVAAALELAAIAPLEVGGEKINLKLDGNRQLSFVRNGKVERYAYIPTETGIRFYEPIELGGKTINEFTIATDLTAMTVAELNQTLPLAYLPDANNLNEQIWTGFIAEGLASEHFLSALEQVREKEKSIWNWTYVTDRKWRIGKNFSWVGTTLEKYKGTADYRTGYRCRVLPVYGDTTQIHFEGVEGTFNWNYFKDTYPVTEALIKHSPYKVSDKEGYKYFVSVADTTAWFYLKTDNEPQYLRDNSITIDFYKGWMSDKLITIFDEAEKVQSSTYTVSKYATLGFNDKNVRGITFSNKDNASGNYYYCNYQMDFVPVVGDTAQVRLFGHKPGRNWSYFTNLMPVVQALIDNSPYKVSETGGYRKLVSVKDASIWFYEWKK